MGGRTVIQPHGYDEDVGLREFVDDGQGLCQLRVHGASFHRIFGKENQEKAAAPNGPPYLDIHMAPRQEILLPEPWIEPRSFQIFIKSPRLLPILDGVADEEVAHILRLIHDNPAALAFCTFGSLL